MKLTPLDIHHKEFRHSLRGYSEEEVDQFLDEVADEFERLFKENIDLNEKIDALQAKVNEFEMQRQTINNTLVTAQRSADDIVVRAQTESEGILSHANTRAKEIVNDALAKKQHVRGELLRIKHAEEEFRDRYRALLEGNLRQIDEVRLDDDVNALLAGVDQSADELLAGPAEAPGPVAAAPAPMPSEPVSPAPARQEAAPELPRLMQPTEQMPPVEVKIPDEPPTPGFVQAVTLGEIDSPDIPADVTLVEPSEFALPGFDALGEREDDVDIEEID